MLLSLRELVSECRLYATQSVSLSDGKPACLGPSAMYSTATATAATSLSSEAPGLAIVNGDTTPASPTPKTPALAVTNTRTPLATPTTTLSNSRIPNPRVPSLTNLQITNLKSSKPKPRAPGSPKSSRGATSAQATRTHVHL
ncbi:hypothetical protein K439DRAFT_1617558 [Ramaria rubella]|nr:hypothetical protein K439DRAFT_1617558 [Ramaria rubella]